MEKNKFYCGDNLEVLRRHVKDEDSDSYKELLAGKGAAYPRLLEVTFKRAPKARKAARKRSKNPKGDDALESHPFGFAQGRLLRTERARMGHPAAWVSPRKSRSKAADRSVRSTRVRRVAQNEAIMKPQILAGLLVLSSVALAQTSQEMTEISLPGKSVVLEMKLADLKVDPGQTATRPDGSGAKIFASNNAGLVVSAFLQKEPGKTTAAECRDDWFGKMRAATPFPLDGVKLSERGRMALAEYIIHTAEGREVEQKNVHAYLGSHDICAEVHISKISFRAGDEKLIDAVLDSVRLRYKLDEEGSSVTANSGPSSSSDAGGGSSNDAMELFRRGSAFYIQGNYRKAIEYYQPALDSEMKRPQLGKAYWTVLVDNLGMAYGISGDLERAKQVFQYGLSKEPKYPMFHYNMACAYAEGGDMESTIGYLKTAYQYRSNSLPSESMPNPRTDSSFQRFMKDPRFLHTLAELGY